VQEEAKKTVKYDIDGHDIVTNAINEILNKYPNLEGEEILFSTLGKESGIGWFPVSGAIIAEEKTTIKGITKQVCNYPFYVIYRTGEGRSKQKVIIKEFLDNMGKWLERQTLIIDGETHRLESYPALTENREIIEIARQTPSYLDTTNDGVEDWAILITLKYKNEFRRN